MCPFEHVRGVSCQGWHHQGHEVRILIVVRVVSDTAGPLPKGVGHIMRMTLLAPKFGDLDLTRKSILFLSPPSRGASLVRVTTTLVTSTSSAPVPPVKGLIRDGGISGYPVIIRRVAMDEGCLLTGEPAVRPRVGLPLANPFRPG